MVAAPGAGGRAGATGGDVVTALDEALWPRAALPRRPMLGAVLDALTVPSAGDPLPSYWCGVAGVPLVVSDRGRVVSVGSPYHSVRYPWIDASVAEAYELLQARDLVPMDYVGRFVCGACNGTGLTDANGRPRPAGARGGWMCACHGEPQAHPPTVAALASWASLGFAAGDDAPDDALTIPRAEALAGDEEFAGAVRLDAPPVWWRVYPPGADASRAYPEGTARRALCDAGLGFQRMSTHTMLYVPPLGLVTP